MPEKITIKGRRAALASAVAFLFFLVKGLAWIVVPVLALRGCS